MRQREGGGRTDGTETGWAALRRLPSMAKASFILASLAAAVSAGPLLQPSSQLGEVVSPAPFVLSS